MKNKRRLDEQDDDLVNVLRQRFKQDEKQKQINAQQTFEILMNSQRQQQQEQQKQLDRQDEPSYVLFNNPNTHNTSEQDDNTPSSCYRCNRGTVRGKCGFCEHGICSECAHICNICENVYCGGCSTIDYSTSFEKVFCLSCKSG
ncbi:hypothetical protein BDC45DRAFT_569715 [Circinella umbellata]|nr:hypothetical protein BDC45DRAFT_569715 [Circinella umbellata]